MGNCFPQCFEDEPDSLPQEDLETRRQKYAEAAAQRQKQQESKGVKNPELLKAKQARREQIEKKAVANGAGTRSEGLKWTVG